MQAGTGLHYPLTLTLAPTGLASVCTVKALLSSRSAGIAPPPRISILLSSRSADIAPPSHNFCWRSGKLSLFFVLCTWAAIPRNLSLFYLLAVASSSSPLFWVMVGPMSVPSMLSPLLRSANGRMTSGHLAKLSFVKINVDSQDRIRLLLISYR